MALIFTFEGLKSRINHKIDITRFYIWFYSHIIMKNWVAKKKIPTFEYETINVKKFKRMMNQIFSLFNLERRKKGWYEQSITKTVSNHRCNVQHKYMFTWSHVAGSIAASAKITKKTTFSGVYDFVYRNIYSIIFEKYLSWICWFVAKQVFAYI